MNEVPEAYITIPQLIKLKLIPIGKNKIYELIATRRIRSYKIGCKPVVLLSEVHEDVKRNFKVGK